ncbi:cobalamin biosynthesis protein [Streptomyces solicavernae]|uniref:cobalamin biosynthesis protein n=1 Tax=Streptomyces solicavernae TaxID=3043614 RepID=UPI0038D10AF3
MAGPPPPPPPPEPVPAPGTLVVGVGAGRGVPVDEVLGLVRAVLREAGQPERGVGALATVDAKAGEPGVVAAASALGVPLLTYPAAELAQVAVPHPAGVVLAAVGTPSVAEAAALAAGGRLLVPKRRSSPEDRPARATCALASVPARLLPEGNRVTEGDRVTEETA